MVGDLIDMMIEREQIVLWYLSLYLSLYVDIYVDIYLLSAVK